MNQENDKYNVIEYLNSNEQCSQDTARAGLHSPTFSIPPKFVRTARLLADNFGSLYDSEKDSVEGKQVFGCKSKVAINKLLDTCTRLGLLRRIKEYDYNKHRSYNKYCIYRLDSRVFENLMLIFGDCIVKEHFIARDSDSNTVCGKLLQDTLTDSFSDYSLANLIRFNIMGDPVYASVGDIDGFLWDISWLKRKFITEKLETSQAVKGSRVWQLPGLLDCVVNIHVDLEKLRSDDSRINGLNCTFEFLGDRYVLGDVATIYVEENRGNELLQ